MENPKVSVLVPIYNVEKYLDACLESLCSQSLKELEILCLDDGSTDRSPKILAEYARSDPRIRVARKKNSGYGDTMNKGLKVARGEYVGIVESDDFVDKTMFEDLYHLAKKFDADIVRENYFHFENRQDKLHKAVLSEEVGRLISPARTPSILYEAPAIWSGLYRRDFLMKNQIGFLPTPGAAFQDTSFNFKCLLSTDRLLLSETAHLHYRLDNASSSVNSLEKVFYVAEEYHEIERFAAEKNLSLETRQILQATKFGAYHWNLLRLPNPAAEKFTHAMREEFLAAKNQGLLEKSVSPSKWWVSLNLLLKSEKLFLASVRLYRKTK